MAGDPEVLAGLAALAEAAAGKDGADELLAVLQEAVALRVVKAAAELRHMTKAVKKGKHAPSYYQSKWQKKVKYARELAAWAAQQEALRLQMEAAAAAAPQEQDASDDHKNALRLGEGNAQDQVDGDDDEHPPPPPPDFEEEGPTAGSMGGAGGNTRSPDDYPPPPPSQDGDDDADDDSASVAPPPPVHDSEQQSAQLVETTGPAPNVGPQQDTEASGEAKQQPEAPLSEKPQRARHDALAETELSRLLNSGNLGTFSIACKRALASANLKTLGDISQLSNAAELHDAVEATAAAEDPTSGGVLTHTQARRLWKAARDHAHALEQAEVEQASYDDEEEGFYDDDGNWISPEEAKAIRKQQSQVADPQAGDTSKQLQRPIESLSSSTAGTAAAPPPPPPAAHSNTTAAVPLRSAADTTAPPPPPPAKSPTTSSTANSSYSPPPPPPALSVGSAAVSNKAAAAAQGDLLTAIANGAGLKKRSAKSPSKRTQLLRWCQDRLHPHRDALGVKVGFPKNFSQAWRSGKAFCGVLLDVSPSTVDVEAVLAMTPSERVAFAFKLADERYGVPRLMDVQDVVEPTRPDDKCIMLYVSYLYKQCEPLRETLADAAAIETPSTRGDLSEQDTLGSASGESLGQDASAPSTDVSNGAAESVTTESVPLLPAQSVREPEQPVSEPGQPVREPGQPVSEPKQLERKRSEAPADPDAQIQLDQDAQSGVEVNAVEAKSLSTNVHLQHANPATKETVTFPGADALDLRPETHTQSAEELSNDSPHPATEPQRHENDVLGELTVDENTAVEGTNSANAHVGGNGENLPPGRNTIATKDNKLTPTRVPSSSVADNPHSRDAAPNSAAKGIRDDGQLEAENWPGGAKCSPFDEGESNVLLSGILLKQGKHRHSWRRRFVELRRDGILCYFKREGDALPRGSLNLDSIFSVHCDTELYPEPHCFQLSSCDGVLALRARDREQMINWMRKVHEVAAQRLFHVDGGAMPPENYKDRIVLLLPPLPHSDLNETPQPSFPGSIGSGKEERGGPGDEKEEKHGNNSPQAEESAHTTLCEVDTAKPEKGERQSHVANEAALASSAALTTASLLLRRYGFWINALHVGFVVRDLRQDVRDGVLLARLLGFVDPEGFRSFALGVSRKPCSRAAALHNIEKCLYYLYAAPSFPNRCIPTAESLYAGRAKAVRQLFGQIFRTFALKPALRVFSNCLDWFASVFSSVVGDEGSAVAILNPSVLRKLNIRAGQRLKPAGDGATLCNFFRSGLPFLAVLLAGCDAACQLPDATPASAAERHGLPPSELVDTLLWDSACGGAIPPSHASSPHQTDTLVPQRHNKHKTPPTRGRWTSRTFVGGSGSGLDKRHDSSGRTARRVSEPADKSIVPAPPVSLELRELVAKLQRSSGRIRTFFEEHLRQRDDPDGDDASSSFDVRQERQGLGYALQVLRMLGVPVVLDLDLFLAAPDPDFLVVQLYMVWRFLSPVVGPEGSPLQSHFPMPSSAPDNDERAAATAELLLSAERERLRARRCAARSALLASNHDEPTPWNPSTASPLVSHQEKRDTFGSDVAQKRDLETNYHNDTVLRERAVARVHRERKRRLQNRLRQEKLVAQQRLGNGADGQYEDQGSLPHSEAIFGDAGARRTGTGFQDAADEQSHSSQESHRSAEYLDDRLGPWVEEGDEDEDGIDDEGPGGGGSEQPTSEPFPESHEAGTGSTDEQSMGDSDDHVATENDPQPTAVRTKASENRPAYHGMGAGGDFRLHPQYRSVFEAPAVPQVMSTPLTAELGKLRHHMPSRVQDAGMATSPLDSPSHFGASAVGNNAGAQGLSTNLTTGKSTHSSISTAFEEDLQRLADLERLAAGHEAMDGSSRRSSSQSFDEGGYRGMATPQQQGLVTQQNQEREQESEHRRRLEEQQEQRLREMQDAVLAQQQASPLSQQQNVQNFHPNVAQGAQQDLEELHSIAGWLAGGHAVLAYSEPVVSDATGVEHSPLPTAHGMAPATLLVLDDASTGRPAGDLLSLRVVVQDASPAAHAFVVDVSLDEVVTVGELQPYDSSFVLSARTRGGVESVAAISCGGDAETCFWIREGLAKLVAYSRRNGSP